MPLRCVWKARSECLMSSKRKEKRSKVLTQYPCLPPQKLSQLEVEGCPTRTATSAISPKIFRKIGERYRSHLRKVFIFAGQKTTKIRNRNRKRKLLLKPRRVALVGGNCLCFDTLRTEVDQIPEITDANVYPHVFNRRDSVRFSKEK